MPQDAYDNMAPSLQSPAVGIEEITPDDLTDLGNVTRALNVTTAGAVRVITADGSTGDVFVAAGIAFPIRASRVLATGTTATGIRGLY